MDYKQTDNRNIWHPFTQMKTEPFSMIIERGEGSWLFDMEGKKYLDAISSWWVNIHGHAHPKISSAIAKQAAKLEQVIFAGFSHPSAIELSEKLLPLVPGKPGKIFFSDDGSTSIEVAMKMAIQYFHNTQRERKNILAFENAYHGDTFGAMSVGGPSIFNAAFKDHLFGVDHLPVPVEGREEECIASLKRNLKEKKYAAFIFEPLVQGAGGMVMYKPEVLDELIRLCRKEEIIIIADEVFTGFGRTGTFFACDQINEKPDIVCISKGLTGGFLPMGITACRDFIYDAFLSDEKAQALFHGHSYTANPIACSAALASIELMNEETFSSIKRISEKNKLAMKRFINHDKLENVRSLGTIFACEIKTAGETGYLNEIKKQAVDWFISKGIIIRPLGNVLYTVPPYCTGNDELEMVFDEIELFLKSVK